jgi:hypothetical protein
MIAKAAQVQLRYFQVSKLRPSSLLAEDAENYTNSALGGAWVEGGGGRRSWSPLSCLQQASVLGGEGGGADPALYLMQLAYI